MAENIQLSSLLGTCLEFRENPTEENKNKVEEMVRQLQIRAYLPFKFKEVVIVSVLANCEAGDLDALTAGLSLAMAKVVYGVLSYVINLENDLDFTAIDAGAIDLLYELEVVPYILKSCSEDYQRLEHMIDSTLNFSNLIKLANVAKTMTPENIELFTQTVADLKSELTEEKLDDLKSLVTAGSTEWTALKQTVADEVLGRVLDKNFHDIEVNKKEESKEELKEDKEAEAVEELKAEA